MNVPKQIQDPTSNPLDRRMQTLAVVIITSLYFIGAPLSYYLLYKLLYSTYWWAGILYIAWLFYDIDVSRRGGRSSEWVQDWAVWRHFCDYFPIKLVKTTELDSSKNYILCTFPHGVASYGTFGALFTNARNNKKVFPGISFHTITISGRFLMPFMRELFLAFGGCSSTQESITYLLNPKKQKGKCVVIAVGGTAEVLDIQPGEYNIRLMERRGFVRVAMMTGSSLVPVISFGETSLFKKINHPEGTLMRRWHKWFVRVFGLIPVIPTGRGIFSNTSGFLPYRVPVTVVVGAPIEVVKNLEPTKEDVDTLHAIFVKKLVELFENEKEKYIPNHENVKLVIN